MPRAHPDDVRAIIELSEDTNVYPFILTASALTDYVVSKDTNGLLTTALAKQIEIYLSAHFTELRDRQYDANSTLGESATFQGKTGMGLDNTKWGQAAKTLDVTGLLASLDKKDRPKARMLWLGKPPSNQIDYVDRD